MEQTPVDIKARLLADRVTANTGTVEIEGVGPVTVRGLTRFEFAMLNKRHPEVGQQQEAETIAICMVDPPLTVADVEQWQKSAPAMELNTVAAKINELSGIAKGADKEAYKSA